MRALTERNNITGTGAEEKGCFVAGDIATVGLSSA